jgi:hypothetical protein
MTARWAPQRQLTQLEARVPLILPSAANLQRNLPYTLMTRSRRGARRCVQNALRTRQFYDYYKMLAERRHSRISDAAAGHRSGASQRAEGQLSRPSSVTQLRIRNGSLLPQTGPPREPPSCYPSRFASVPSGSPKRLRSLEMAALYLRLRLPFAFSSTTPVIRDSNI